MRDIRFRAWDKACRTMISCGDKSWHLYLDGGSSVDGVWATRDLELMQSTGLTDSKGVEIYEGDIVTMYPNDIEVSQTKEVKWCDDRPSLGFDGSGPILCQGNSDILLIIGNIHENPELLEV